MNERNIMTDKSKKKNAKSSNIRIKKHIFLLHTYSNIK